MEATATVRDALRAAVRDALVKLAHEIGPSRVALRFGMTPLSVKRYMAGDRPSYTASKRMAPRLGIKAS